MSCMRHSYPKGSAQGQRQCRRCSVWDTPDGKPFGSAEPAGIDLSMFMQEPSQEDGASGGVDLTMFLGAELAPSPTNTAATRECAAIPELAPIASSPPCQESGSPLSDAPLVSPPVGPTSATSSAEPASAASLETSQERGGWRLPEHSRYGGSNAERWLNCPGSTALVSIIGGEKDDPDYRKAGVLAHELGAHCLTREYDAWEAVSVKFPSASEDNPVTTEMMTAVQVYLDYVRLRPGRKEVECKMHRPELHPEMFGTIDCKITPITGVDQFVLEIVDYKNGAGVVVSPENNAQMLYYAALEIFDEGDYPDDGKVILTIVQPNSYVDPKVRSWATTVKYIKDFAETELVPGMRRGADWFDIGKWCQFCPAKLICPAMSNRALELAQHANALISTMLASDNKDVEKVHLAALADEVLGRLYSDAQAIRYWLKAIEVETFRRLMSGREVAGAKLGYGKADRVFKKELIDQTSGEVIDFEKAAAAIFGNNAYTKPVLLSPAQMEKLPQGEAFVATWAYKPEAGYRLVPDTDGKPGVKPKSGEGIHSQAVQKYLDTLSP